MTGQLRFWPRVLGPAPTLTELTVLCWGCFLGFVVLPLCLIIGRHGLGGPIQDNDFVYFYGEGRILNLYPPSRLYDFTLQQQTFNAIHHMKSGVYGPSPYPPFVALFFRPFASLPFSTAFALWTVISLALYVYGLHVLTELFGFMERDERALIFCLALSFYPFLFTTLLSGQISTIGFCAVACALREVHSGRLFRAGLAVSICTYKPTLLVLLVPMLIITAGWRSVLGFAAGGSALAAAATILEGPAVWSGYLNLLLYLGHSATGVRSAYLTLPWTYIDLNAFVSLLPGGRSSVGLTMLWLFVCAIAGVMVRTWWKHGRSGKIEPTAIWAATITWSLLLNVYVPIYDATLAVAGMIATAGLLKPAGENRLRGWFVFTCILILSCSWFTETVARSTGIQILTILLAVLGLLQLAAVRSRAALLRR